MRKPRIRGKGTSRSSPYDLGEFPDSVVTAVGKRVVHRLAVGHADITGDDFGDIFARATGGGHLLSTLGVADVVLDGCAWSIKTVKHNHPFRAKSVRLISGRNSPDYSHGISDSRADIHATGRAVLSIWNERVDQSLNEYDDLRIVVLVRSIDTLEFVLFEYPAERFIPSDYEWSENKNGNFEGKDKRTNEHCFTWQPHGSQFTVIRPIPGSAYKFKITKQPSVVEEKYILSYIGYNDDWITRMK